MSDTAHPGPVAGPFSIPADHSDLIWMGLMSGTSTDGVDAVLVRFLPGQACEVLAHAALGFDQTLRADLLALQDVTRAWGSASHQDPYLALEDTVNRLTHVYADCAEQLLAGLAPHDRARVRAAGAHGQTIRHRPALGITVQHFNPALFHLRTGLSVVSDFRRADVACGGQGAPLVPAFHRWWLQGVDGGLVRTQAVLNIGGFANLTALHADGRIQGQDTGPGNVLMDAWTQRHLGTPMDRDGNWAASGNVHADLLVCLLAHPYFSSPLPRSTGRDAFHLAWLDSCLASFAGISPADVQATLLELTVQSVVRCLPADCAAVWVCGGGAFNGALMRRLQVAANARLQTLSDAATQVLTTPSAKRHHEPTAQLTVRSTADLGVDPQQMEALAFAWLARQRLCGLPGNVPEVTGARSPVLLGALTGL